MADKSGRPDKPGPKAVRVEYIKKASTPQEEQFVRILGLKELGDIVQVPEGLVEKARYHKHLLRIIE